MTAPRKAPFVRLATVLRLGGLAAAVAALAGCSATNAVGTFGGDGSGRTYMQALYENTLGGLGLGEEPEPIHYRPRSPLVVPPKSALASLPPPAATRTAARPDWPNDPDVAARNQREAERSTPIDERYWRDATGEFHGRRLTPQEIQAGRVPGGGVNENVAIAAARNQEREDLEKGKVISPLVLRQQSKAYVDARRAYDVPVGPDGKPIRRYLTDPPSELRLPAPGAEVKGAEPTAAREKKAWWWPL